MFGLTKTTDTIKNAEEKAQRKLGFISDFINQLETAKQDSLELQKETVNKIERLNNVMNNAIKVENYVNKILKVR